MREEADCSGLVNGEGVRSGMLSSLARMKAFSPGRRGKRQHGQIDGLKIKKSSKALEINRAWRRGWDSNP